MNNKPDCENVKKTRGIDPGMAYFNKLDRCKCKKASIISLVILIIVLVSLIWTIAIFAGVSSDDMSHFIEMINK